MRDRGTSQKSSSLVEKEIRYRIRYLISLKKSLVYGIIIIVNEREEEKQDDRKQRQKIKHR